jgi:cell division protein FtsI/penicillin-binding protein 2
MMREVISSGTALRMQDLGEVYGKTGEAEVEGGSHAWFAGYRGDLAFATLVVLGGSSDNAVAVTHEMLVALPE